MRTGNDVCQRAQRRLYLRYRAAVLGDELGVHPEPFLRERQDRRGLLGRLLIHGRCPDGWVQWTNLSRGEW